MKMKKARLALYITLACLLVASALGTAYAKYTSDHEMEEFKVYVTAGTITLNTTGTTGGLIVIPGKTIPLTTPPTVTVEANSEACYVFLKVANNVGKIVSFDVDETEWTLLAGQENIYYKEIDAKTTEGTTLNVVTGNSILVPHTATAEQIETISESSGNNTIIFTAYAVQKTHGIETPADAWSKLLAN